MRAIRFLAALFIAAILPAPPGSAAAGEDGPLQYHGFTIDLSQLRHVHDRDAVVASVKCQILIVEGVGLPADTIDFFRSIPIRMMPGTFNGHYDGKSGLQLGSKQVAEATPVVLHEYLHAFQGRLEPAQQRQIGLFYQRARATGAFRPDAYMLSNFREYFAMTGTAVLVGNIEREPLSRARVQAVQPVYYDWLVRTFGVDTTRLPAQDSGWAEQRCRSL